MGDIKQELSGGILKLTLDRAAKKNALTRAMYEELAIAFEHAAGEGSIRVLLLTGSGDAFTSGNDIQDFMADPPISEDAPVSRFLKALTKFPKPLVIAVNGIAIGIGVTMLLHADLVYADAAAEFQLPFVKLALVPEAASSYLLPRLLGHPRAAELLFLGERFSAMKAKQLGLINEICRSDELQKRADAVAAKLASAPPEALRLTKSLMRRHHAAIDDAMRAEGKAFAARLTSPEALEAFAAFMDRRAPDFSKFE